MRQKNKLFSPGFDLLGYHTSEISFTRDGNSKIKNVTFTMDDVKWDIDAKTLLMVLKVDFNFDGESNGLIKFTSVFQIDSEEWIEKIQTFDSIYDNESIELLAKLQAVTFPYLRQVITSLTMDSAYTITLPVIDMRLIVDGGTLEFHDHNE